MDISGIGKGRPISAGQNETPAQHTVQKGETLEGIAKQYGFAAKALLESNPGLKRATSLKAGMTLNLPQQAAPPQAGQEAARNGVFETFPKRNLLDRMLEPASGRQAGEAAANKKFYTGELAGKGIIQDATVGKVFYGEAAAQKASSNLLPGEASAGKHLPGEALHVKGEAAANKKFLTGEALQEKHPLEEKTLPGELQAKFFKKS